MFLQEFLRPHISGQGGAGTSDASRYSSHEHMTPLASHVPIFFNEQLKTHYVTPPIPYVSAPSSGRRMLDRAKHGIDAKPTIDITQASFPGSSHVTSMRKI